MVLGTNGIGVLFRCMLSAVGTIFFLEKTIALVFAAENLRSRVLYHFSSLVMLHCRELDSF